MHLIRGGTVKVMKGVSALFSEKEILDGTAIRATVLKGKADKTEIGLAVWESLSAESRMAIESSAGTDGSGPLPQSGLAGLLAGALNGIIKGENSENSENSEKSKKSEKSEKSKFEKFAEGLATAVPQERIGKIVDRYLPGGQARSAHGCTLAKRLFI
jgi:hypothetical protein